MFLNVGVSARLYASLFYFHGYLLQCQVRQKSAYYIVPNNSADLPINTLFLHKRLKSRAFPLGIFTKTPEEKDKTKKRDILNGSSILEKL